MRSFNLVAASLFMVSLAACAVESAPSEPQPAPAVAASGVQTEATCTLWQYTCSTTNYQYGHDLADCQANCKGGNCHKLPDCL